MGGWGAGEPIARTFRTYKLDEAHGIMFCGVRFTHFCITSPRETTNHVTQVLRITLFGCHVALKAGFTQWCMDLNEPGAKVGFYIVLGGVKLKFPQISKFEMLH